MELSNYKKDILRNDISTLFESVFEKHGRGKLERIFSHIVESPIIVDMINKENKSAGKEPTNIIGYYNIVTDKVLKNSRNLVNYINYLDSKKEFARVPNVLLNLKLLVYLQVTETTFIFKVFWNCLKVLKGEELDSEVFDDYISARTLIQLMKLYEESGFNFKCILKWNNLIDRNFRNTIAHNDYYLERDTMLTSSGMTSAIKGEEVKNPVIYNSEQINEFYEMAVNFNEAFIDEIQAWSQQFSVVY